MLRRKAAHVTSHAPVSAFRGKDTGRTMNLMLSRIGDLFPPLIPRGRSHPHHCNSVRAVPETCQLSSLACEEGWSASPSEDGSLNTCRFPDLPDWRPASALCRIP